MPKKYCLPQLKLFIALFFLVFLLSNVSANYVIANGTIFNTSISNTSISFNLLTPVYSDLVLVNPTQIEFYNASYTSSVSGIHYFNISYIKQNIVNKHVDAVEFPYIVSSTETIKQIKSNLSNYVNLTISNVSVRDCAQIVQVAFDSASGAYSEILTVVKDYNCSSKYLNSLALRNVENTSASSFNLVSIGYYSGAITGGGASYTFNALPSGENNTYLCFRTFEYIKKYGQTNINYLDELVERIKTDRNYTESKTKLQDYMMNWQLFCSVDTNYTLKEEQVCDKIYYWLINNNQNYTNSDIIPLKKEIDEDIIGINYQVLKDYVYNYDKKCAQLNNKKLPISRQKLSSFSLNLINDLPKCSETFNNSLLDAYLPFFNFNLNGLSCAEIDNYRWIFRMVNVAGNDYKVTGIKLNIILIPIIIIFGVFFLKIGFMYLKKKSHQIQVKNS